MARLIDADAMLEYLNLMYDKQNDSNEPFNCAVLGAINYIKHKAPTIDAVSVVHGEWIHDPQIGWGETWVCSICGEKTISSVMGYPRYNYCPMCGAKMDGERKESE